MRRKRLAGLSLIKVFYVKIFAFLGVPPFLLLSLALVTLLSALGLNNFATIGNFFQSQRRFLINPLCALVCIVVNGLLSSICVPRSFRLQLFTWRAAIFPNLSVYGHENFRWRHLLRTWRELVNYRTDVHIRFELAYIEHVFAIE